MFRPSRPCGSGGSLVEFGFLPFDWLLMSLGRFKRVLPALASCQQLPEDGIDDGRRTGNHGRREVRYGELLITFYFFFLVFAMKAKKASLNSEKKASTFDKKLVRVWGSQGWNNGSYSSGQSKEPDYVTSNEAHKEAQRAEGNQRSPEIMASYVPKEIFEATVVTSSSKMGERSVQGSKERELVVFEVESSPMEVMLPGATNI
ncbi:phosphatidylserine decarboxylase proenzyme [Striga asiatica]|uniref:Phosphatidylserine decarboxylase proenzyme n=1 Tax=Striga asiatica TaxID=4170 RepID=A0A5A7PZ07_STRAF|nr:phosphatidylserine decarboxylase proenzyme [Striga asiatica]